MGTIHISKEGEKFLIYFTTIILILVIAYFITASIFFIFNRKKPSISARIPFLTLITQVGVLGSIILQLIGIILYHESSIYS